jgi:NitT/TauT family transport system permease protein
MGSETSNQPADSGTRDGFATQDWVKTALSFIALLVLWELATRLLKVPEYVLPAPSAIVVEFPDQAGRMLTHSLFTGQVMVVGYIVAILVSIPLALLIAYSRVVETTVYPLVVVFQIVPKIAIAPLFIIWFGFGFSPKMMVVFLLCFFPMLISAIAGFKMVDPEIMELTRTTGARGWTLFVKIRLPQALPSIFTGLKVGAALAATAAVVAEFIGSNRGLGYLILEYNGNIDTARVLAAVILLSIIGMALYYAVEFAERIAIPWHVTQRGLNEVS